MNILFLTAAYPNPGNPAEGLFHEQQVLALAQTGVEGAVVLCKPWLPEAIARGWRRYRPLASLPREEERNGIPVFYSRYFHLPSYRCPQWTLGSCIRSVLRTVRQRGCSEPIDLLQVYGTWPIGIAAPVIADALGCPFVVTLHIQDDERFFESSTRAGLYRDMARRAAAMVAVGRPLKRYMDRFHSDSLGESCRVIPNGVNLAAVERAMKEAAQGPGTGGRIISVGNLWPIKGVDLNLRALANLARLGVHWDSYTIVGDGPEKERLKRLTAELRIKDRVYFKGRLSHGETLKEIAQADVLSLPSWQEAFGVAYLEAMACGKPVIGCRGQGAEDIIRHGKEGLLVEAKSTDELTDALKHLLTQREYARAMGHAGMARAHEFTWERNAARYMEIYERACGRIDASKGLEGAWKA